jgi:hypothetical protein
MMSTDEGERGIMEQASRIQLKCPTTGKLLARISLSGTWPAELRQWLWCRGCHYEHEITGAQIEEARVQDARASTINARTVRSTREPLLLSSQ